MNDWLIFFCKHNKTEHNLLKMVNTKTANIENLRREVAEVEEWNLTENCFYKIIIESVIIRVHKLKKTIKIHNFLQRLIYKTNTTYAIIALIDISFRYLQICNKLERWIPFFKTNMKYTYTENTQKTGELLQRWLNIIKNADA